MVCCNQRSGKSEGMGIMQINQTTHSLNVNIQAARKALSNECTFAAGIYTNNQPITGAGSKAWCGKHI
jgi:hypothetical protein